MRWERCDEPYLNLVSAQAIVVSKPGVVAGETDVSR